MQKRRHVSLNLLLLRACTWFASIPSTPGTPTETTRICATTKIWTCCPGSRSSSEHHVIRSARAWLPPPDVGLFSFLCTASLTCTPRPQRYLTSRGSSRTTSLWSTSTVLEYWSGEFQMTRMIHNSNQLICWVSSTCRRKSVHPQLKTQKYFPQFYFDVAKKTKQPTDFC